jgi:hypothetical protein
MAPGSRCGSSGSTLRDRLECRPASLQRRAHNGCTLRCQRAAHAGNDRWPRARVHTRGRAWVDPAGGLTVRFPNQRMGSRSTLLPKPLERRRRCCGSTTRASSDPDSLLAGLVVSLESTCATENRSRAFGPGANRRAPSSAACLYTHAALTSRWAASVLTSSRGTAGTAASRARVVMRARAPKLPAAMPCC